MVVQLPLKADFARPQPGNRENEQQKRRAHPMPWPNEIVVVAFKPEC
jgi:hypothetical protein